jgi:hypothetical protein
MLRATRCMTSGALAAAMAKGITVEDGDALRLECAAEGDSRESQGLGGVPEVLIRRADPDAPGADGLQDIDQMAEVSLRAGQPCDPDFDVAQEPPR